MNRVAVFLDADNVLPFDDATLPPRLRSAVRDPTTAFSVIARIEQLVQPLGEVVVREAYGRWDNPARHAPAAILAGLDYRLRHVPPLDYERGTEQHSLKNAADILLSVRAALATGAVETVVLVAMDSDYQPLVTELRAAGVAVVGIGFARKNRQAAILRAGFDRFEPLPEVHGWDQVAVWRRTGVADDVLRPVELFAMPAPTPPPAPPLPPSSPSPLPSPPPGLRRPAPPPDTLVDLDALASAIDRSLRGADPLPRIALVRALESFGLGLASATETMARLERDGALRTSSDPDEVAPGTHLAQSPDARRVIAEAVIHAVMAEADTLPGRDDNPLSARLSHLRSRLETTIPVQELLLLASRG